MTDTLKKQLQSILGEIQTKADYQKDSNYLLAAALEDVADAIRSTSTQPEYIKLLKDKGYLNQNCQPTVSLNDLAAGMKDLKIPVNHSTLSEFILNPKTGEKYSDVSISKAITYANTNT
jgi:hypothetical protein